MSASILLAVLVVGALLGAFATVLHALLFDGEMTHADCWSYILGGAFGGMLAASYLNPQDMNARDIVLIAACGFAMAAVVHRLVRGKA